MAKYTIELRKIQAQFYQAMQEYPIFDESYREGLNDRIYHACKNREIGYETVELFIEQLKEWMDLMMPEFNRQYIANAIELTPLQRARIVETFQQATHKQDNTNGQYSDSRSMHIDDTTDASESGTVSGTRENTNVVDETVGNTQEVVDTENTSGNSTSLAYASDFPQNEIDTPADSKYYSSGNRGEGTDEGEREETTNTTASQDTDRTTTDTTTSTDTTSSTTSKDRDYQETTSKSGSNSDTLVHNGTNNYVRERTGNPSYSDFELLEQYRKSFVNVDNLIIKGLKKELFMNIW